MKTNHPVLILLALLLMGAVAGTASRWEGNNLVVTGTCAVTGTGDSLTSSAASGSFALKTLTEGAKVGIGPDTECHEVGTTITCTGSGGISVPVVTSTVGNTNSFAGPLQSTYGSYPSFYAQGASGFQAQSGAAFGMANKFAINTAPTISSGFGGTPSIPANNGTVAFTVNIGTGGIASSGVIGLPTAATGWKCLCDDLAAAVGVTETRQSGAVSTTGCTISNVNTATGVAAAWGVSEVLLCSALAY